MLLINTAISRMLSDQQNILLEQQSLLEKQADEIKKQNEQISEQQTLIEQQQQNFSRANDELLEAAMLTREKAGELMGFSNSIQVDFGQKTRFGVVIMVATMATSIAALAISLVDMYSAR